MNNGESANIVGAESPPTDTGGWLGGLARAWDDVVAAPLREIDAESRAYLASTESRSADRKTIIVLVSAAVISTAQAYLHGTDCMSSAARGLAALGMTQAADALDPAHYDPAGRQFYGLLAMSVMRGLEWLLVPALIIRFVLRESITDYGIKLRGLAEGWWIYVVMLIVMIPLLTYFSSGRAFLDTYPYYRLGPDEPFWPYLILWEFAYIAQFFFLEFFYRGFMVQGTRHRFGAYSIFVMTIPYCMIHFGKPWPETLGSIVAGIVLGFMSLKTRSIWLGTALHVSIALSMDALALHHMGRLG